MKNFEQLGRKLTKEQQKKISGGAAAEEPDGWGCSVKCYAGHYACCWRNIMVAYCRCLKDTEKKTCDAGGPGASECQIDQN